MSTSVVPNLVSIYNTVQKLVWDVFDYIQGVSQSNDQTLICCCLCTSDEQFLYTFVINTMITEKYDDQCFLSRLFI